jgi:hypothetical protein
MTFICSLIIKDALQIVMLQLTISLQPFLRHELSKF